MTRKRFRQRSALGAAGVAAVTVLASASGAFGATTTQVFNSTGGTQQFVVPAGINQVSFLAVGGKGGGPEGGFGASITGTMPVTSGQTLCVVVGGNGSQTAGGFNGGGAGGGGEVSGFGAAGGGGGATDIRPTVSGSCGPLNSRQVVAAGGGGIGSGVSGRFAGGAAGQKGADTTPPFVSTGGNPGTESAGGAAGTGSSSSGSTGSLGIGGQGGVAGASAGGGGGGGGLYGGGGGGTTTFTGSGGGGGSSYTGGASSSTVGTDDTGNPRVTFTYEVPMIGLAPGALAFGNQLVGSTSAAQSITVSNTGTAPLILSDVSIAGAGAGDFLFDDSDCAGQVSPSTTCEILVSFEPTATGSRGATLNIESNDLGSPDSVALSGTGVAPGIDVDPASLDFGDRLVATTSAAQTVTVDNVGTATLTVDDVSLTGSGSASYLVDDSDCTSAIPAGDECSISVRFQPSAPGPHTASLAIESNDAGSPDTVGLNGTGIAPQIDVAPGSLDFGGQQLTTTSASRAITVSNPGTAPLTVNSGALMGSGAGDFVLDSACGTVPPGGSCDLRVSFRPTATGARSASVSISSDGPGPEPVVALSGTGLAAPAPSNAFSIGSPKLNKRRGTAALPVTVPGPGQVSLGGPGVRSSTAAGETGTVSLPVVPTGKTKRKLRKRGRATVTVAVSFTPTGGSKSSDVAVVKLRRKRR